MSHRSPLAFLSTCLLSAFFVMGCEPPPAEWLTELSCADGELAFVTEEMDGLIEETECQPIPATCPADGAEDWLDDLPADCVEDLCGTDSPGTMQTGIYTQPDTDDEYVVFGCTP